MIPHRVQENAEKHGYAIVTLKIRTKHCRESAAMDVDYVRTMSWESASALLDTMMAADKAPIGTKVKLREKKR